MMLKVTPMILEHLVASGNVSREDAAKDLPGTTNKSNSHRIGDSFVEEYVQNVYFLVEQGSTDPPSVVMVRRWLATALLFLGVCGMLCVRVLGNTTL